MADENYKYGMRYHGVNMPTERTRLDPAAPRTLRNPGDDASVKGSMTGDYSQKEGLSASSDPPRDPPRKAQQPPEEKSSWLVRGMKSALQYLNQGGPNTTLLGPLGATLQMADGLTRTQDALLNGSEKKVAGGAPDGATLKEMQRAQNNSPDPYPKGATPLPGENNYTLGHPNDEGNYYANVDAKKGIFDPTLKLFRQYEGPDDDMGGDTPADRMYIRDFTTGGLGTASSTEGTFDKGGSVSVVSTGVPGLSSADEAARDLAALRKTGAIYERENQIRQLESRINQPLNSALDVADARAASKQLKDLRAADAASAASEADFKKEAMKQNVELEKARIAAGSKGNSGQAALMGQLRQNEDQAMERIYARTGLDPKDLRDKQTVSRFTSVMENSYKSRPGGSALEQIEASETNYAADAFSAYENIRKTVADDWQGGIPFLSSKSEVAPMNNITDLPRILSEARFPSSFGLLANNIKFTDPNGAKTFFGGGGGTDFPIGDAGPIVQQVQDIFDALWGGARASPGAMFWRKHLGPDFKEWQRRLPKERLNEIRTRLLS